MTSAGRSRLWGRIGTLVVTAWALGCGVGEGGNTELVVFAASSLGAVFGQLEADYESRHPGIDVLVSVAGSQVLRLQIEQGAPADVFVSANARHMKALVESGVVSAAVPFARNGLAIAVPLTNPAGIERFTDLPRAQRLVVGTADVPVGEYTRALLRATVEDLGPAFQDSVWASVVSEETNVRLVLAKVTLGEADAAIVYRTDAATAERVHVVEIPGRFQQTADYYVGRVTPSAHPEEARRFVDYIQAADARAILAAAGFEVP